MAGKSLNTSTGASARFVAEIVVAAGWSAFHPRRMTTWQVKARRCLTQIDRSRMDQDPDHSAHRGDQPPYTGHMQYNVNMILLQFLQIHQISLGNF
jgi:hypothetical protein